MSGATPPPADLKGPIAPGSSSYVPTRKVDAGALAGAVSMLLVRALNNYVLPSGKPITPEISSAFTTVLTFIVSYFIPEPA